MRTLLDCKIGEKNTISTVDKSQKHLLELGFTPGESIEVLNRTPFKGPISIRVRGTVFAIRQTEASAIQC
jgi:ferrous iron transport protein A